MGQTTSKHHSKPLETTRPRRFATSTRTTASTIDTEPTILPETRRRKHQHQRKPSLSPVSSKFLPKVLLHPSTVKNTKNNSAINKSSGGGGDDVHSRASISTGQLTPLSPLGSSSSSTSTGIKNGIDCNCKNGNLQKEATVLLNLNFKSNTNSQHLPSTQKQRNFYHHHNHQLSRSNTKNTDKRSNPVKFPRRRQTIGGEGDFPARNPPAAAATTAASAAVGNMNQRQQQTPTPDSMYLERMYDSRTWEMYRRITHHREKVEAFNTANAEARRAARKEDRNNEDRHSATNLTTVSEPALRRVARAESISIVTAATAASMCDGEHGDEHEQQHHEHIHQQQQDGLGGSATEENHHCEHYNHHAGDDGNCYFHAGNDDDDGNGNGNGIYNSPSEEHSAPPYHHQHTHYCDSGRQHLHPKHDNHHHPKHDNHHHPKHQHYHNHPSNENYSEWEHMYGDVEDEEGDANGECGSDPTIFLFDF